MTDNSITAEIEVACEPSGPITPKQVIRDIITTLTTWEPTGVLSNFQMPEHQELKDACMNEENFSIEAEGPAKLTIDHYEEGGIGSTDLIDLFESFRSELTPAGVLIRGKFFDDGRDLDDVLLSVMGVNQTEHFSGPRDILNAVDYRDTRERVRERNRIHEPEGSRDHGQELER